MNLQTRSTGLADYRNDTLSPQIDRCIFVMDSDSPIFEIRVTTSDAGSILRALTEREVAVKAETLIRRVHARGELVALSIAGPGTAAVCRIRAYLEDVLTEVTRLGI